MDLTVGNAVSRQDIRYGMGFREKILQRFAALDIEFRNIGFLESFFLLGLEALFMGFSLTGPFHDAKSHAGLHAFIDEPVHDIVTS